MPWHIEADHPDCSGFAVVKDNDGSLVACHETREKAERQLRALYANEPAARTQTQRVFDELALVRNVRSTAFTDVELSGLPKSGLVQFEGHAAVYDEQTQFDIPGIGTVHEVIDRGAFRKVLAGKPQVPMFFNHDPNFIIADTANGTLTLKEDARGLFTQAELDTYDPDVNKVVAKIRSGLIRGMSFGFVAGRENQKVEHRSGVVLRRLSGFKKLLDVGPVVGPAYSGTDVAVRSALMQFADSSESLQQILMGAYPQLEDGAAPDEDVPAVELENDGLSASGVAGHRSVAARKRAFQFLVLTTGGLDDAS